MMKYISSRYNLDLVYPSFSKPDVECQDRLKKYCSSVTTVRIRSFFSRLRCLKSLIGRNSLTLSYFFSRELKKVIDSKKCDVVLVDCSSMAQYVMDLNVIKIIDFVDIDSEKWREYSEKSRFPKSMIYHSEYNRLKRFENDIINRFDSCIVISENEKNLLKTSQNIFVVPNGIDQDYFKKPERQHGGGSIIFTGAMDYLANVDGVLYFHKQVFPLIKKEIKGTRFIVAGMNPVLRIRNLASEDTTVTGYISDIRECMATASICVVPLRIARGVQNKILEAMAMEIPVVATSAANQGINARNRIEIMIADSPSEFAQATVALLKDRNLQKKLATNAKGFVEKNFSWGTNLRKLDEIITCHISSSKTFAPSKPLLVPAL